MTDNQIHCLKYELPYEVRRIMKSVSSQWSVARGGRSDVLRRSHANILAPQLRTGGNEIAHHLDAGRVIQDFQLHALRSNVFLRSLKGHIFTNDDSGNLVEQRRAAAHGTGRERGIKGATRIDRCLLPAGILETIHFRMTNHTAFLHALVVSASDDFSIKDEHRSDRNAAGGEPLFRLLNRRVKEWIHRWIEAGEGWAGKGNVVAWGVSRPIFLESPAPSGELSRGK